MARVVLEQALPADWVDQTFDATRQRQYPRALLMSTVIALMLPVALGLQPSLHAAARRQRDALPVSLVALYNKVKRTEPAFLRALIQGSAARLQALRAAPGATPPTLPGYQLRLLDGNHLPASEKRCKRLRTAPGAALPGHALVVYDPDADLVVDLLPCEDAYESERVGAAILLQSAAPGELWLADRHFCTRPLLQAWGEAGACVIVREPANHPRAQAHAPLQPAGRSRSGAVAEQRIGLAEMPTPWRRIRLELDTPTEAGATTLWLWSNLPDAIPAATIADLYHRRWGIEALFGRLEGALASELRTLDQPRAALLGFASALLAYNVLALLKHHIEQAHAQTNPPLAVSVYHLVLAVRTTYAGLCIALPEEAWAPWAKAPPAALVAYLQRLAAQVTPHRLALSRRGPKQKKTKPYVAPQQASRHFATARVLKQRKEERC